MEYFLGSLWCGCGEWRVMVSGVYRGQRAERQECGSWRSEFDWFHHPAAGHSHQGIRADRASELRWCSLVHFKSYSQIKCDYILQDILLFSLAIVQCPRVKSFHINSCLQCSFTQIQSLVWYLQKIYCETKSDRIFWHLTSLQTPDTRVTHLEAANEGMLWDLQDSNLKDPETICNESANQTKHTKHYRVE